MAGNKSVDQFLDVLSASDRATADALRQLIAEARPDLSEHIKWNAPSFCHRGEDRITLGVERKGGLRVVLHRGAKPADASAFRFGDPVGLARWPAPDRGVLTFTDKAEVKAKRDAVRELFARWIEATALPH